MNEQNYNKILLRLDELEKAVFIKKNAKSKIVTKPAQSINFNLNHRTFVSRHVMGKSGPKKFVLIVAFLSKGVVGKEIKLSEVKNLWGKMETKKLLGKYNDFYSSEAKTKGWVDSTKRGFCHLTNEWEEI